MQLTYKIYKDISSFFKFIGIVRREKRTSVELYKIDTPTLILKEYFDRIVINSQSYYQFLIIPRDESIDNIINDLINYSFKNIKLNITLYNSSEINRKIIKNINKIREDVITGNEELEVAKFNIEDKFNQVKEYRKNDIVFSVNIVLTKNEKTSSFANLIKSKYGANSYQIYFTNIQNFRKVIESNHNDSLTQYPILLNKSYFYKSGIYLGNNIKVNTPIFLDIFSMQNYNMIVLARSGAGKTTLAKEIIIREIFNGVKIFCIDPENEYTKLKDIFDEKFFEIIEDVSYFLDNIEKESKGKTLIFIDEAHKYLDDKNISKKIRHVIKTGRKYNIGVVLITQDVIDFLQNRNTKTAILNSGCIFLLKQHEYIATLLGKVFGLSSDDLNFLIHSNLSEVLIKSDYTNEYMSFSKLFDV